MFCRTNKDTKGRVAERFHGLMICRSQSTRPLTQLHCCLCPPPCICTPAPSERASKSHNTCRGSKEGDREMRKREGRGKTRAHVHRDLEQIDDHAHQPRRKTKSLRLYAYIHMNAYGLLFSSYNQAFSRLYSSRSSPSPPTWKTTYKNAPLSKQCNQS